MSNLDNNKSTEIGNTFVEFLTTTVKYRWFLFWFVTIITLSATGYALFGPKWYKSTASVLPAEKNDPLSMISGLSGLAKGFSATKGLAALTGQNSESQRYMAILMSATITNEVIKKFDLVKEYDMEDDYYDKVVKEWQSNLDLEIQDEGNLTITVFSRDSKKAADIANYMVERLNTLNTQLSVTNAKANREFVEKRYFQNINDISELETNMKLFQEKYGVIAVPEQLEATVKSMATIYVDLYKKEVEYNVIKQTYGIDHPITKNAKLEMDELNKKISALNNGTDVTQQDVKLLIPFKLAPKLGNEYLKIYRNLEIQYKILEFVQPLYEQAKVEEARNTPSVIVLDNAGPADRKSRPKGSIYAPIAFVLSLIFGYFIIFTRVFIGKIKERDNANYIYIVSALKSDLKKIGINRSQK